VALTLVRGTTLNQCWQAGDGKCAASFQLAGAQGTAGTGGHLGSGRSSPVPLHQALGTILASQGDARYVYSGAARPWSPSLRIHPAWEMPWLALVSGLRR